MPTQPSEFPRWASVDENDPITGAPNKQQPSTEFQSTGLLRQEPLLRDHINWQFDNIDSWIEYLNAVTATIVVNTTVYVAVTGNDTTGDGTILSPYATPHKALQSLVGVPIATEVILTISCAAGDYNFTEPVIVNHPYGERIQIVGDTMLGIHPSGVPVADWSVDKTAPTVSIRTADEFYNSAGMLPTDAIFSTRLAAIQSDLTNNIALLQGRFATRFNFTDSSGLQVQGNNSLGLMDRILLVGDWAGSDLDTEEFYGIDSGESLSGLVGTPKNVSGGTIFIGSDTSVIGFRGDGFRARYGGVITCDDGVSSVNNLEKGFNASFFSSIIVNGSTAQGNLDHGYLSISTAFLRADDSYSSGNGGSGVQAQSNGSLFVRNTVMLGNSSNGIALTVGSVASMDGTNSRGNGASGMVCTIGSSTDADLGVMSDNEEHGVYVDASSYDGQNLTIERNGNTGITAINNASASISSSTIGSNDGDEIFATRGSSVNATSNTLPSGSTVTADKNSYISIPSIGGVTYSPAYGVVTNEALISV